MSQPNGTLSPQIPLESESEEGSDIEDSSFRSNKVTYTIVNSGREDKSGNARLKLVDSAGFAYHLNNTTSKGQAWRCCRRTYTKCKASVSQTFGEYGEDDVFKENGKLHSHPPDERALNSIHIKKVYKER